MSENVVELPVLLIHHGPMFDKRPSIVSRYLEVPHHGNLLELKEMHLGLKDLRVYKSDVHPLISIRLHLP